LRVLQRQHDVVRALAFDGLEPAEGDDVAHRQVESLTGLDDGHRRREAVPVAPVHQHQLDAAPRALELHHAQRPALQALGTGKLEEQVARQPHRAGLAGRGNARAQVHRVAGDLHAVGQHAPPVQADAQRELVFARAQLVGLGDPALQFDHRVGGLAGALEQRQRAVSGGVDQPPLVGAKREKYPVESAMSVKHTAAEASKRRDSSCASRFCRRTISVIVSRPMSMSRSGLFMGRAHDLRRCGSPPARAPASRRADRPPAAAGRARPQCASRVTTGVPTWAGSRRRTTDSSSAP
jgi:hypothetical protein